MSTKFIRVSPGTPFAPRASEWNEFVEAAEYVDGIQNSIGAGGAAAASGLSVALLKNTGAVTLPQFSAAEITGVAFEPVDDDSTEAFRDRIVLSGKHAASDAGGKLAIPLEPIIAGDVGAVAIDGVVQALVTIADEGQNFAALKIGSALLETAADGPAEILFKQASEDRDVAGQALCLVRLSRIGAEAPDGQQQGVVSASSAMAGEVSRWEYTVQTTLAWNATDKRLTGSGSGVTGVTNTYEDDNDGTNVMLGALVSSGGVTVTVHAIPNGTAVLMTTTDGQKTFTLPNRISVVCS